MRAPMKPSRDWKLGVPRVPPPREETWDGGLALPDDSRHPDPLRKMKWLLLALVAAVFFAFGFAAAVGK